MEVLNAETFNKQRFYGGKLCKVCLEYDDNMEDISDYLDAKCKSILYECDDLKWKKLPCWLCSKCENVVSRVVHMRDRFKQFLAVYEAFSQDRNAYEEVDSSFIRTKIISLKQIIENETMKSDVKKNCEVEKIKSETDSSEIYMKIKNNMDEDSLDVTSPLYATELSEIEPMEKSICERKEFNNMIKQEFPNKVKNYISKIRHKHHKEILKKEKKERKNKYNKMKKKHKNIKRELKEGFSSRMVVETDEYRVIRFTKARVLAELDEKRQSVKYQCMPFKCERCVKGFNYEDVLANHMDKHAAKADDLECDICGQFTNGKIAMRGHLKSHLTRYECKVCGVVRASRQHLLEHHASAHSYAHALYICSHCGKSSTKRTMFQKHMKTHYPSNSKNCDKCGKLFKSIDTLRAHLLRHADVMRYKCEQCPKEFRYASLLYTHRTTHTTTRDYYCVECDASFKTASYLKLHLRKSLKHVDPETFKHECEHCHRRFDRTVSLRQHVNWVHLRRRDHKCSNCDATFASRDGLRNHRRKKHEGVKRPRSHICEVCNKGFMQKAVLQKHLRVHTGERPYDCGECGRKFAQESTMSTHYKLVHLKVKRGAATKIPSDESSLSKQVIIPDTSLPSDKIIESI